MRWETGRQSDNVEDLRGSGGYGGGRPRMPGGFKVGGGLGILALLAALLFGVDPSQILALLGGGGGPAVEVAPSQTASGPIADEAGQFASVILGSTEDVWGRLFSEAGSAYRQPTLQLYEQVTQTACGYGQAASGPFYCPGDEKVYLDLSFLGELERLGAPGDFAVAYVIAHEVGHHLQNITGVERQVRQLQRRSSEEDANALSVLMELQADCFAGVWAYHANQQWQQREGHALLEPGDVEEGLQAAAAVGDDRLQRMAGQAVTPEAFTHGSSAQRMEWLRKGLQQGNTDACDTFGQAGL